MQRAIICKGDRTSHGGTVTEGDPIRTINDRAMARRGHMTFCPACKGNFPINDGLAFHSIGGFDTVVEGMKAACGAVLIASQHAVTVDDGGGVGAAARDAGNDANKDSTAPRARILGAGFRIVSDETGQPLAGVGYRITLPDGSSLHGLTDADGKTLPLSAAQRATATLHLERTAPDDAGPRGTP
jgi:uncharacterized Zn-binding protein involved in type VI secretion